MNPRRRKFVAGMLKHNNRTRAAREAGFKNPDVAGPRLAKVANIAKAIDSSLKKVEEKAIVDAAYVLTRLKDVAERCMQAEEVCDRDGDPTGEWRFDSGGATRSLELLGKSLGLFADKHIHSIGKLTLEQLVMAASEDAQ